MKFFPALLPWAIICLPGCAPINGVPSLAARPYEISATTPAEPSTPLAQRGPDATLVQKISILLQQAREGEQAFARAERENAPVIVLGNRSTQGSDAWIAGETARSALEASRRTSAEALAALDDLLVENTLNAAAYPVLEAIRIAQSQAESIASHQFARLDQLRR